MDSLKKKNLIIIIMDANKTLKKFKIHSSKKKKKKPLSKLGMKGIPQPDRIHLPKKSTKNLNGD